MVIVFVVLFLFSAYLIYRMPKTQLSTGKVIALNSLAALSFLAGAVIAIGLFFS